MQKSQTTRHWKQIHHSRKSTGSLNDSFHSNRSSLSSGYNRFSFHKNEDIGKRSSVFHFKARNKDNPYDISILTKKEQDRPKRPLKLQTQQQLPNLSRMIHKMPTFGYEKTPSSQIIKSLAKQLKQTIDMFRNAIRYFSKQFNELKNDWDRNVEKIFQKSVVLERKEVENVRKMFQAKQKEFQKIVKEVNFADKAHQVQFQQFKGESSSIVQSPMKNLGISKVDSQGQQNMLSRNNTLQSLLNNAQHHRNNSTSHIQLKPSRQVQSLQQRLKKMREVLDC